MLHFYGCKFHSIRMQLTYRPRARSITRKRSPLRVKKRVHTYHFSWQTQKSISPQTEASLRWMLGQYPFSLSSPPTLPPSPSNLFLFLLLHFLSLCLSSSEAPPGCDGGPTQRSLGDDPAIKHIMETKTK